MHNHLFSVTIFVNVTPEMTKPVQPAVAPEIGRDEQPDERDNEIVIELDRENQYGRTQPRANEPQGNHLRNTLGCSQSFHHISITVKAKTYNARTTALSNFPNITLQTIFSKVNFISQL